MIVTTTSLSLFESFYYFRRVSYIEVHYIVDCSMNNHRISFSLFNHFTTSASELHRSTLHWEIVLWITTTSLSLFQSFLYFRKWVTIHCSLLDYHHIFVISLSHYFLNSRMHCLDALHDCLTNHNLISSYNSLQLQPSELHRSTCTL